MIALLVAAALFAFAFAWFTFCLLVVAKRSDEAAGRTYGERNAANGTRGVRR